MLRLIPENDLYAAALIDQNAVYQAYQRIPGQNIQPAKLPEVLDPRTVRSGIYQQIVHLTLLRLNGLLHLLAVAGKDPFELVKICLRYFSRRIAAVKGIPDSLSLNQLCAQFR